MSNVEQWRWLFTFYWPKLLMGLIICIKFVNFFHFVSPRKKAFRAQATHKPIPRIYIPISSLSDERSNEQDRSFNLFRISFRLLCCF